MCIWYGIICLVNILFYQTISILCGIYFVSYNIYLQVKITANGNNAYNFKIFYAEISHTETKPAEM